MCIYMNLCICVCISYRCIYASDYIYVSMDVYLNGCFVFIWMFVFVYVYHIDVCIQVIMYMLLVWMCIYMGLCIFVCIPYKCMYTSDYTYGTVPW